MERINEADDKRADAALGAIADINDLLSVVAIVVSIEQDGALQQELRRCTRVPDDRVLKIRLPIGGAGMELLPRGGIRALRKEALEGAISLERLALENVTIQGRLRAKGSGVLQAAQAILRPILQPAYLPSRTEYQKLERWSPMIERIAYRLCAWSIGELDAWRPTASREVAEGDLPRNGMLERYYALNHTVAHLTLLCSSVEARPWLVDMAKSFPWIHWTPSFPLIRERTMWLAIAAARSARAFGAGVVDLYLKSLTESHHALKVFDALFGLTAIALSDEAAFDSVLAGINSEAPVAVRRDIQGRALAETAFRSAIGVLQRWQAHAATFTESLDALSWQPGAAEGLATFEAFRADPTRLDRRGEMIGLAALPAILAAPASFVYPSRAKRSHDVFPSSEEMAEIFRRAWTVDEEPATIH
jgi:hypothetical protein